ncbi:uncharacterized protein LOC144038670 isoform X2 [Vanacampus margaritifer]
MSKILLFIQVVTVCYVTNSQAKIEVNCDKNVDLSCPCRDSTEFLLLTWYKKRRFIIGIGEGQVEQAMISQRSTFGENDSLHLPAVTPQDSGTYKCAINAKVGGRNKECLVDLFVHACVTNSLTTTMTNVQLTTIPSAVNSSWDGAASHVECSGLLGSGLGQSACVMHKHSGHSSLL